MDCPPFLPPRDFVGYGWNTPKDCWPDSAKIAVNFALNFEEGGESTLANGDDYSEGCLHEAFHKIPYKGRRDQQLVIQFEYGIRQGLPRIIRLFDKYGYKFTTFAVGRALELAPQYAKLLPKLGHEIASHGYRWRSYVAMPPEEEKKHISDAIDSLQRLTGDQDVPAGWYFGRGSNQAKRLIAREHHKRGLPLLYSSDSFAFHSSGLRVPSLAKARKTKASSLYRTALTAMITGSCVKGQDGRQLMTFSGI